MLSRWKGHTASLTGALAGIMLMSGIADQSGPAWAQPADMKKLTPDLVLSVKGYRTLDNLVILGDKSSAEALIFFAFGLRTTLTAASEAYVADGTKRRVCLPSDVPHGDLLDAINEEIERDPSHWDAREDESIVPLVLQALARKWPCP